MPKKYYKQLVYILNNKKIEFDEDLLKEELETIIVKQKEQIFLSDISLKSFKSDIDDVFDKIDYAVKNSKSTVELLDKYQKRINISNQDIEHIVGISDYSTFKSNKTFNKEKLCLLTICLQLSANEAKQLLLFSSIQLKPKLVIFDYVYNLYISNYQKTGSLEDVLDFTNKLTKVQEIIDERLK